MNLLVTGGSGFIGSNFIETVLNTKRKSVSRIVNLDVLTYAGNFENTQQFESDEKYFFEKVDLCDLSKLLDVYKKHNITHVMHLAAESHVDNSILDPSSFVQSNIVGTFNLLKVSKQFGVERIHHVSTDEVYGELGETGKFTELSRYDPRNPYSASKAASDFLVRSYFHTYGTPITISNCSNNYGPNQHEEKFIPTIINCILNDKKIPLYGSGMNIRDWIYVKDHCEGLWEILLHGKIGETYCIGSNCERKNIEIIESICEMMEVEPSKFIQYVEDRVGHDHRYAIDSSKIKNELGWIPRISFEDGLENTIRWYNEKN